MKLLLANPRGFCAGVDRAIDIVERAITLFGAPIHVRHEVVHNKYVVERLRALGALFVEELDEVPNGATVIFSAHGVSRAVQQEAKRRGLTVFDATCPLVTKVHMQVTRYAREAREVVLIGHAGHPEVEGTMGQFDSALLLSLPSRQQNTAMPSAQFKFSRGRGGGGRAAAVAEVNTVAGAGLRQMMAAVTEPQATTRAIFRVVEEEIGGGARRR